jgi:hypothetical protein
VLQVGRAQEHVQGGTSAMVDAKVRNHHANPCSVASHPCAVPLSLFEGTCFVLRQCEGLRDWILVKG